MLLKPSCQSGDAAQTFDVHTLKTLTTLFGLYIPFTVVPTHIPAVSTVMQFSVYL